MAIRSRSTSRCRPLFRWLVCESDGLKLLAGARIRLERNPKMKAKISALDDLINAALDLFCGYVATHSPYAPDESSRLPWGDEYHIQYPNVRGIYRQVSLEEMKHFAAKLDVEEADGTPAFGNTYLQPEWFDSTRFVIQGLAVETLLVLDHYVKALLESRLADALDWFAAANSNLMDAFAEARELIQSSAGA